MLDLYDVIASITSLSSSEKVASTYNVMQYIKGNTYVFNCIFSSVNCTVLILLGIRFGRAFKKLAVKYINFKYVI